MQRSAHSHLHMVGQHNPRNDASCYRPQEHHVLPTKLPLFVISAHDFIRSSLIIPPHSSFCRLLTSSYSHYNFSCFCVSDLHSSTLLSFLHSNNEISEDSSDFISHLLLFQRPPFNSALSETSSQL